MNINLIKKLATLKQDNLYNILIKFLRTHDYKNIIRYPHFIMADGQDPICLLAHMDTVFTNPPINEEFIYDAEQTILWSPYGSGFDDRAGIYAIIQLVLQGHRPHIIFTDLEEVGGIGAQELIKLYPKCPFKKCKALIQLDRANEEDAVYYDCGNKYFEKFITRYGFVTDIGTFTDISIVAPVWGIAAVNLSVGYLDEHTTSERLVCKWLDKTIERVSKIIEDISSEKKFKYIKQKQIIPYHYKTYNDTCLLCGKAVSPQTRYEIYDTDFPYSVCEDCYKEYYIPEEVPF